MARVPKQQTTERWYEISAHVDGDPKVAELRIFGPIGGGFFFDDDAVSGKGVAKELSELPDSVETIRVLVASGGGSVTDAQQIHNALVRQREELGRNVIVDIDSHAWSAATLITAAGDPIRMASNATMMVHNPLLCACGDAAWMRKIADILDKFRDTIVATYRRVTSMSVEEIQGLMDNETWMDAGEALENGFITEVTGVVEAAATMAPDALDYFREVPEQYRDRVMAVIGKPTNSQQGETGAPVSSRHTGETPMPHTPKDGGAPPVPENNGPVVADAATILRICGDADCLAIAQGLVENNSTVEQVHAAVTRVTAITEACAAAEMPSLAASYISSGMAAELVRDQLTTIRAEADNLEISGNVDPDANAKGTPKIDVNAIYAARNKAFNATQQEG